MSDEIAIGMIILLTTIIGPCLLILTIGFVVKMNEEPDFLERIIRTIRGSK